jgi:hypothetical protein
VRAGWPLEKWRCCAPALVDAMSCPRRSSCSTHTVCLLERSTCTAQREQTTHQTPTDCQHRTKQPWWPCSYHMASAACCSKVLRISRAAQHEQQLLRARANRRLATTTEPFHRMVLLSLTFTSSMRRVSSLYTSSLHSGPGNTTPARTRMARSTGSTVTARDACKHTAMLARCQG